MNRNLCGGDNRHLNGGGPQEQQEPEFVVRPQSICPSRREIYIFLSKRVRSPSLKVVWLQVSMTASPDDSQPPLAIYPLRPGLDFDWITDQALEATLPVEAFKTCNGGGWCNVDVKIGDSYFGRATLPVDEEAKPAADAELTAAIERDYITPNPVVRNCDNSPPASTSSSASSLSREPRHNSFAAADYDVPRSHSFPESEAERSSTAAMASRNGYVPMLPPKRKAEAASPPPKSRQELIDSYVHYKIPPPPEPVAQKEGKEEEELKELESLGGFTPRPFDGGRDEETLAGKSQGALVHLREKFKSSTLTMCEVEERLEEWEREPETAARRRQDIEAMRPDWLKLQVVAEDRYMSS